MTESIEQQGSPLRLPGMVAEAVQLQATVVSTEQLAQDTWVTRLDCPPIARSICPGQFFMIRPSSGSDPLLGRPFALFDVYDGPNGPQEIDFGYTVVGKLTQLMTAWKTGDTVEVWGPLGNGFPEPTGNHLMCVAGGIGQTPFAAVLREATGQRTYGSPPRELVKRPQKLTMCYGVRSADYLAGVDRFQMDGVELRLATDDGTQAHHGYVTELLATALTSSDPPDQVYCCGPEPMMHRVGQMCLDSGVDCWLSLETPMACGFGACFSCVTRVRIGPDEWDYRRTCVEGPVFPARQLVWD